MSRTNRRKPRIVLSGVCCLGLLVSAAAHGSEEDDSAAVGTRLARRPAPTKEELREHFKAYPRAAAFELHDQFKTPCSFSFPRDRITVLMFADRKASDYAEPWAQKLWDTYKDRIDMQGVGVGRWIPFFERPLIRMLVRKATDYSIMLDWKGKVADQYYYQRNEFCVHVIEPGGGIVRTVAGPPDQRNVAMVCATVDRLLDVFAPDAEKSEETPADR